MHQNASECIKMHQDASKCMQNDLLTCFVHVISISKISFFWSKNCTFLSKCSECINMHQNASKCMQNELCKCFVQEIIKKVVVIAFTGAKINEIHLPLYGGTPCT